MNDKYYKLYQNSPDLHVSVCPKTAVIIDCNNTLVKKLGYERDEIIGAPIFFVYAKECLDDVKKAFDQFIKTGKIVNYELILETKNKEKFPVLLNVEAIKNDKGDIIYSNSTWRDISETKILQKEIKNRNTQLKHQIRELELKNRELSQFAYIASHDLQEPLHTISGFLNLLISENYDQFNESSKQYIDYISNASTRMKTLISDLLNYSSIGSQLELTQFNSEDAVHTVLKSVANKVNKSKASITLLNLPTIYGYRGEIELLFQNLISNALKFKQPNTSPIISIGLKSENDEYWTFFVQDNGIGIDEKYKERIFKIFQRLHNKDDYSGTGIGLSHAQKIVEIHNGSIWFESDYNEGTTFLFTISKKLNEKTT